MRGCGSLVGTILLDLLINLGLGFGFALCARDRVRVDGPFAMPAFLLVLVFLGLILAPAVLYLYWVHPAWSWLYLVDPANVPGLAVVPVLVVHGGLLIVGWYLGARLERADKHRALLYVFFACMVTLGVLVLVLRSRLGAYGSLADFRAGRSAGLLDVKLGYVLIAMAPALVASAGFTALELLRDSRRVRAR